MTEQQSQLQPRHGEYKMPGGKLVVVDFAVEAGELRRVMVSGDFFLYPDSTLADISAALEGITATSSEADVARHVRDGLAPGAELIGVTPEGIGVAVRRALDA
ncbi:MAG TPA: biotin--protein ligase [Thermomicrobiales bacterium]|nr:biotin--protein ligase [Thermomicrobiales bacterium]